MKKILIVIYTLTAITIFSESVKVGFFNGYPTNYRDEKTGVATGSTIDYLKDFLSEMGYQPEFIGPLPFPRLLNMLKSGEIDGLLGLSYVDERKAFVYYPDKPYRISYTNIIVLKESPLKEIKTMRDIESYAFSFRNGAVLPDFFIGFENLVNISYLSRDTWIDQSLQLLELKRIDGIINSSELSIYAAAKKLGLKDHLRTVLLPGNEDPLYLGFSRNSPIGEELVKKYNRTLKTSRLKIEHYDKRDY